METREYRTVDKGDWPKGPWMDEPDKRQWTDQATGLPCLIVRNRSGALRGYVGVSRGHPAFEKEYDLVGAHVHGGLTFAGPCSPHGDETSGVCHAPAPGEPDDVWWLGFDCTHIYDAYPLDLAYRLAEARKQTPDLMKDVPNPPALSLLFDIRGTYKNVAYVTEECEGLAKQLSEPTLVIADEEQEP